MARCPGRFALVGDLVLECSREAGHEPPHLAPIILSGLESETSWKDGDQGAFQEGDPPADDLAELRSRLDAVFGDPDEELSLTELVDNALRAHAVGWGYAGQEMIIREGHEKVAALVVQLLEQMRPWQQWPRGIHTLLTEITLALAQVPTAKTEPLPSPVAPLRRAAHLVKHLIQQVDEFTGVVSPDGHKEDDAIRDGLEQEALEWERIADRLSGVRSGE